MAQPDTNPEPESAIAAKPKPRTDRWVKLIFLAVVLAVAGWVVVRQWVGPIPPGFGRDLPAALAAAKASDRRVLVLVDIYPPGEDYKWNVTFIMDKPKNREALKNANVVGVRTTPGEASKAGLKIKKTPTTLLLRPDATEITRWEGRIAEMDFPGFLEGKPPP